MIFKAMLKEEWRIHSTLFGNVRFLFFPIMILFFSFLISLSIPLLSMIVPLDTVILVGHYMFLLFGISVGGFGLFGRESMNRRFGQASLLAYSAKTLPLSERSIFLRFFIKDIVFYFIFWILPIISGLSLATFFIGLNISIPLILISLTLSFLIGLSVIFLMSTIYAYSSKAFVFLLTIALISIFTMLRIPLESLPSFAFFISHSTGNLVISWILIIVPSTLSLSFLKVDYPQNKRHFENSFEKITEFIKNKYSPFISKDFLDLHRSEGGLGKLIFSYLLPIIILWILISKLVSYFPGLSSIIVLAIFMGIFSPSIYNWLTEFDVFSSYSFLPLRISEVIKSKLMSYSIINLISILVLILAIINSKEYLLLFLALIVFISISIYVLSVTIYLSGLQPNLLLYNVKIFGMYIFTTVPLTVTILFISAINYIYLFFTLFLIPLSWIILNYSYKKWDNLEQPVF